MAVVIVLMGVPGSGKSTVAALLAARRDLRIISRDAIREALFSPCTFTEEEKHTAYRALLVATGACLTLGRSCVIDGMPFSRTAEINDMRSVAMQAGAHFLPVMLDCPLAVAQARARADVASGQRDPADRDAALVAQVSARFQPPPADAFRLDATQPPELLAQAIERRFDELTRADADTECDVSECHPP